MSNYFYKACPMLTECLSKMDENIVLFVSFSILAAFIYMIIPLRIKRGYLLLANALFYLLLDFRYFFLLLISILISYGFTKALVKKAGTRFHKVVFVLGITFSLSILAFFKYCNFFLNNQNGLTRILMPLGISYYTFKIVSCLFDTYKTQGEFAVSLSDYAIYISFFPQIICGPITRADEICNYINPEKKINLQDVKMSGFLIISGLFKKIVIADRLSLYVNTIFSDYTSYPAIALWMAVFFFTVELYCDFAGYSEIVIGITRLFGFHCEDNFKLPYFSTNIKEFWNRWHISLSAWLRDYIYIPLGGNRVSKTRQRLNVLIVFLVSGIWHGNNLNFIIWGIWHGILSILSPKRADRSITRLLQSVGTFICVMFGWILFKTDTLMDSFCYIKGMFLNFSLDINSIIIAVLPFTGDYACLAYLLTVCMFIILLFVFEWRDYTDHECNLWIRATIFIISILFFGTMGKESFIYANF